MSSGKKSANLSAKSATENVDALHAQVSETLRKAGADSRGMGRAPETCFTMKALLHQYTQCATLTEVDEDGEHPLFPRCGGQQNNTRQIQGASVTSGLCGRDGKVVGQELIVVLLRRLENDRLPRIKDAFLHKDNGLNCEEFVALLHEHIRSVAGGDDCTLPTELARLHCRLCRGPSNLEASHDSILSHLASSEIADPAENDDAGDGVDHCKESFVSWPMFAKLLLDTGLVAEIIKGFNIVHVLRHIEFEKIAALKDEFANAGDSLNVEKFILVMKRQFSFIFELLSLCELRCEERHLIGQIADFFEVIDINGSRAVSWEAFTNFLIDQGMSSDGPNEFDTILLGYSALQDELSHTGFVEGAVYLKQYDKIAYFEQDSKGGVKICTPALKLVHEIQDLTQRPLCVSYIEKEGFLVVSCSDLTLSFYDANNLLRLVRRISCKTAQLVMCWSAAANTFFTADHTGMIFAWDTTQVKVGVGRTHYEPGQGDACEGFLKLQEDWPSSRLHFMHHIQKVDEAHVHAQSQRTPRRVPVVHERNFMTEGGKNIVMALLELEVLGLLASCGNDKLVMLWDIFTGRAKTTLKGHELGVRCMAFSSASKVLVTGGYDYNLMVWNPYVGTSIHSLRGHNAYIIGIEVLGTSQIVSADAEGFVKTWDLGTYQCLQTLPVVGCIRLRAFVSVPGHKRVWCAERRFQALEYLNTGVADQTDEAPIIKALYIPRLYMFLSGSCSHVRIWDAFTGGIKCTINHKDSDITDFCVDDRGRKVFVADHAGRVTVYNSTTGSKVKQLTKHAAEISGIEYCRGDQNVITISWDNSMVVHHEHEQAPWRSAKNLHLGEISSLAFSRRLGLVATGSTDCVIVLCDYERMRPVSFLNGHKAEITTLAFVDPFPLLVSADAGGIVAVWAVPSCSKHDSKYVNEVLIWFVNMHTLESTAPVTCCEPLYTESVKSSSAAADSTFLTKPDEPSDPGTLVLYTGDQDGNVRVWDLTKLLYVADIRPCAPKANIDPFKKVEIDYARTTEARWQSEMSTEEPELLARIKEAVARELVHWEAHLDSIQSVKVYNRPEFVLTSGFDHMVKIWSLKGTLLTVLRSFGSIPWHFPVEAGMMNSEDQASMDLILEKVERLENSRS